MLFNLVVRGLASDGIELRAEFVAVAARATVPPSRPVKAAVSTREFFEIFMTLFSFVFAL